MYILLHSFNIFLNCNSIAARATAESIQGNSTPRAVDACCRRHDCHISSQARPGMARWKYAPVGQSEGEGNGNGPKSKSNVESNGFSKVQYVVGGLIAIALLCVMMINSAPPSTIATSPQADSTLRASALNHAQLDSSVSDLCTAERGDPYICIYHPRTHN